MSAVGGTLTRVLYRAGQGVCHGTLKVTRYTLYNAKELTGYACRVIGNGLMGLAGTFFMNQVYRMHSSQNVTVHCYGVGSVEAKQECSNPSRAASGIYESLQSGVPGALGHHELTTMVSSLAGSAALPAAMFGTGFVLKTIGDSLKTAAPRKLLSRRHPRVPGPFLTMTRGNVDSLLSSGKLKAIGERAESSAAALAKRADVEYRIRCVGDVCTWEKV